MSSNDLRPEDAPLTEAELNMLSAIDAARTPGPFVMRQDRDDRWNIYASDNDDEWIAVLPHQCLTSIAEQRERDARAIVAALNALPLLLAEVRRARAIAAGEAEPEQVDDTGPRQHIPRDLLSRP